MPFVLPEALLQTAAYKHTPAQVHVCETHISWVFLTGEWAFKVKKPLTTPYLDYGSLERRREACEAELRLNQRFAPELYHSVVPIVANDKGWRVEGKGVPVEYAVKMREFPRGSLLKDLLTSNRLSHRHIQGAALEIAVQHQAAACIQAESRWGIPRDLCLAAQENFDELSSLIDDKLEQLERLRQWTMETFAKLEPLMQSRRKQGSVRECHGDLHLGNLIWFQNRVRLFDGIEFNESFRWIDLWNDFAFLLMDLEEHEHWEDAGLLRNSYVESTGDYEGLRLEKWFKVYRAMVRAKVAALKSKQVTGDKIDQRELKGARQYLDYAEKLLEPRSIGLVFTHGPSGSGKTTLTQPLLARDACVRVRSDIERKRLHGVHELESSHSDLNQGIYSETSTDATYDRLAHIAKMILEGGNWAIVDATCLQRAHRLKLIHAAEQCQVPWYILACSVDEGTLRERIRRRKSLGNDASEATIDVLTAQQSQTDTLSTEENQHRITFDALNTLLKTSGPSDMP